MRVARSPARMFGTSAGHAPSGRCGTSRSRHQPGDVDRRHRQERRGQVHAAEDPVAHHRADRRARRSVRPSRQPARSRHRVSPGSDRTRERLPERRHPGHEARRDRPQVRRDRRLRRGRAVHRHARQALLERDVHAAGVCGRRVPRIRKSCSSTKCSPSATRASRSDASARCATSARAAARCSSSVTTWPPSKRCAIAVCTFRRAVSRRMARRMKSSAAIWRPNSCRARDHQSGNHSGRRAGSQVIMRSGRAHERAGRTGRIHSDGQRTSDPVDYEAGRAISPVLGLVIKNNYGESLFGINNRLVPGFEFANAVTIRDRSRAYSGIFRSCQTPIRSICILAMATRLRRHLRRRLVRGRRRRCLRERQASPAECGSFFWPATWTHTPGAVAVPVKAK